MLASASLSAFIMIRLKGSSVHNGPELVCMRLSNTFPLLLEKGMLRAFAHGEGHAEGLCSWRRAC